MSDEDKTYHLAFIINFLPI